MPYLHIQHHLFTYVQKFMKKYYYITLLHLNYLFHLMNTLMASLKSESMPQISRSIRCNN